MPQRYDSLTAPTGISYTGAGALRIPASKVRLARTGIQTYTENGQTIREYRSEAEVLKADSLATLAGALITIQHAEESASPENWKQSVGWVSDKPATSSKVDGQTYIGADLIIQDADAIQAVVAEELSELSAGYKCKFDNTPGTSPEGEPYDRAQIDIRFNHVALLRRGQARAGQHACLRLDSKGELISEEDTMATNFEVDNAKLKAEIDTLKKDAKSAAKLEAERDTLQANLDAKDAADAKRDAELPQLIRDAVDLRNRAGRVLGPDYDFKGKSDSQVRKDALSKLDIKVEGKGDTYVAARLDAEFDRLPAETDHGSSESTSKKDSKDDKDEDAATKKDIADARSRLNVYGFGGMPGQ